MEIMEFCQKVRRSFADYAGAKVTVTVKQIIKNNGIVLHSIIVTEKEMNVSPNIYLDDLHRAYEEGETFRAIMDEVQHIYENSRIKKSIDIGFFLDYEKMKERVMYKVISYEKNKELLLQVPHISFLDLAIVFYCFVPQSEFESATILIYNNHLKVWKISKERLYQDAERNTCRILPAKLCSIEEMMREIFDRNIMKKFNNENNETASNCMGRNNKSSDKWAEQTTEEMIKSISEEGGSGKMYILGNEKKLFGAAAMLYKGILEDFADRIGKNLFILPSSIHEVILIPDDEGQEAEDLWKMVCDINATQVEPEEVLTDSVYYFSRKNKKVEKLF